MTEKIVYHCGKLSDLTKRVKVGFVGTCEKYYTDSSGVPMIRTTNLSEEGINLYDLKYVTAEFHRKNVKSQLHCGDILIARHGTNGRACVYNGEEAQCLNVIIIEPDYTKETSKYLEYLINSSFVRKQIASKLVGSTQHVLNTTVLANVEVSLPDIEAQNQIVEVLEKTSRVIQLRKSQLEQLDELIKSQFVEIFGDIVSNSNGWDIDILDKHLEVIGGYAFKSEMFVNNGIPVLKIGNINAGYFKSANLVFWKEDEKLSKYLINPGDLVISLTGTVGKDDYGNVCIMGDEYPKYYLNQRNAKLALYYTLDKHYLTYALKVPDIKKKLTGVNRGVRQANISNKDIQSLELPIPPIYLQNQFATFVQQVDKLKFEVQKSLDETQILFESLMQKYFG